MAMSRIQFQHGMSLPEFLRGFGTEAARGPPWRSPRQRPAQSDNACCPLLI
jgi:hypothetical protein